MSEGKGAPATADTVGMRTSASARAFVVFAMLLACTACVIPNKGTPVFVDANEGRFWSGEGMLVEVAPDKLRCRVVVRDRAFVVRDKWVACRNLHPRKG